MDKNLINVFEVKPIKKEFGFKISAADVFNEFLYLGDEKGSIHSYPIRVGESDVIAKNQNQTNRSICKYKIDKILCYPAISTILVLAGQTLYTIDSALKRAEPIASKISDFAINENFQKEGLLSVVAITRKKEGFLFFYNPHTKKLQDTKNKFNVSDVPTCVAYTQYHIILAMKKEYESLNIEKSFALRKGPLQAKHPFVRVIGSSQILCFSDDIGLLMSPEFEPKPKDNIVVNRPVLHISLCGGYCFILCDNSLQIYSNFDKRFVLIQEIPLNGVRGITNERPFIFNKDDVYFLYQIPYQTQIRNLLDKCRVDEAIALLIQNIGSDNQQKIQQLKINAVWPLLKRMSFEKAKELIKETSFDIREVILLFPELVGLGLENMNAKAQKTMPTMIIEFINEKAQKSKDEETELKKKSKLFLKEVMEYKRDLYLAQTTTSNKIKKSFFTSKNSPIKQKLREVTAEELLEIIDFTLIKWFFQIGMLHKLEDFLLANPVINCQKMFFQFEEILKTNQKLYEVPALKPRMYTAFERYEEAFECWRKVAETSQKQSLVKIACQEAVTLLTKFEDRNEVYDKLEWILRLKPETAMNFFAMVPLNFIQPDEIIKKFQNQKQERYLELYLQTIVIDKNTQIEAYHTKLMLLYIESLFRSHPRESKEEGKTVQFQQKLIKFRKLERNPNAKYAAEPIIRKIEKCEWLLEDQIFLYSREKRHEDALRRYISKSMSKEAQRYCEENGQKTLTIYFKMLLTMYKSFEASKNNSALLLKKDIVVFLKKYSSNPELDPLTVLELIPDDWMLNDFQGVGGIYQFLESAIIHTLHEKRTCNTAKHLSEMDLLNVEYNLIEAKRAYLRFTIKKKCCICNSHIADKYFVVYPNANVCHQACVKKEKNTICPITKQDFEKTFKY